MKKTRLKKMSLTAIFTALIAASAWISIYTPFGINLTLQTFAVSLAGLCLGARWGVVAVAVYIATGATGLPVFSSFAGGFGVLLGVSGGFLWGFLITALLCGVASKQNKNLLKYMFMVLSVLICHVAGVIQFSIVSGNNVRISFLTASLPFLVKDLLLVFLAQIISQKTKKRLVTGNII